VTVGAGRAIVYRMIRAFVIVAVVLAQSALAQPARFEVASVKPATETKHGLWYTGEHVRILGLSVHELIAAAIA
jgi:hypothetical protein